VSGLTPTGFVPKTTEDVRGENVAQILADVDATLDLSDAEPMGQVVGIEAGSDAELWELVTAIYDGLDPDNAEGDQLDAVGALRGIPRKGEAKSFVLVDCTLAVGTYAIGALKRQRIEAAQAAQAMHRGPMATDAPPPGRRTAVDRQIATMNALTGQDRSHGPSPAADHANVVDVDARVVP